MGVNMYVAFVWMCSLYRLGTGVWERSIYSWYLWSLCIDSSALSSEVIILTWWRHQMETFSAWLAICEGNSPVPGEFPAQRPVTRSFDVFFDLRLNKRLSKQSRGWWFQMLSHPLWRHCNGRTISRIRDFARSMTIGNKASSGTTSGRRPSICWLW